MKLIHLPTKKGKWTTYSHFIVKMDPFTHILWVNVTISVIFEVVDAVAATIRTISCHDYLDYPATITL